MVGDRFKETRDPQTKEVRPKPSLEQRRRDAERHTSRRVNPEGSQSGDEESGRSAKKPKLDMHDRSPLPGSSSQEQSTQEPAASEKASLAQTPETEKIEEPNEEEKGILATMRSHNQTIEGCIQEMDSLLHDPDTGIEAISQYISKNMSDYEAMIPPLKNILEGRPQDFEEEQFDLCLMEVKKFKDTLYNYEALCEKFKDNMYESFRTSMSSFKIFNKNNSNKKTFYKFYK